VKCGFSVDVIKPTLIYAEPSISLIFNDLFMISLEDSVGLVQDCVLTLISALLNSQHCNNVLL